MVSESLHQVLRPKEHPNLIDRYLSSIYTVLPFLQYVTQANVMVPWGEVFIVDRSENSFSLAIKRRCPSVPAVSCPQTCYTYVVLWCVPLLPAMGNCYSTWDKRLNRIAHTAHRSIRTGNRFGDMPRRAERWLICLWSSYTMPSLASLNTQAESGAYLYFPLEPSCVNGLVSSCNCVNDGR